MERRTTHGNRVGRDEQGKEVLLSSLGQQVMMEWEKQYMERCVDALGVRSTDRVLEIGFGLAYSAARIQCFAPAQHTIIECDRDVLERAEQFAVDKPGIQVVSGTWQQMLPTLGQFDCVFFDDYPLPELMEDPQSALQMTDDSVMRSKPQRSRWHEFLRVALHHCATGARISGYLSREIDLRLPGCKVSVESMLVETPENCNYFPHKAALVPVITVVDPVVAAERVTADVRPQEALPPASKRFKRAFEKAKGSSRPQVNSFSEQQRRITQIQEFLLAHEMDALSYAMPGQSERVDVSDETSKTFVSGSNDASCGFVVEGPTESRHYKDEHSRREFLRSLRSKMAASKQMKD